MLDNIKQEFPILNTEINGNKLIYLDGAASAQKPQVVLDALNTAYTERYSNVHSGVHKLSVQSTEGIERARSLLAEFLNAPSAENIVFYSGATEAINQVAWDMRQYAKEGDNIVITIAEHHANMLPWQRVCERLGLELRYANIRSDASFDYTDFIGKVDERTVLVAAPHVSNVSGTLFPVKKMADVAHSAGAFMLVDGCQGCVHAPVDVQDLNCDYYVGSSHKLYGPSGVGFLYGRMNILEMMEPLRIGGGAIDTVTTEGYELKPVPYRFEAGTPPIAEVAAFGEAIKFLLDIGMENVYNHEVKLLEYATNKLSSIEGINIVGSDIAKGGVISFYFDDVHSVDLATLIAEKGVCIRAGLHCAHPFHTFLNIPATARASINVHNDEADFDALHDAIVNALRILR